ncbi:MAG TPA: hypothetical protein VGM20_06975 [Gemmatimonadales bacterium]|jgi:hypothetical protein
MSDPSLDGGPDIELGSALREALELPWGGAFVNRVRARMAQQRTRSWDEELAAWFWQGLVAASLVTVLAGWGLNTFSGTTEETDAVAPLSVAGQLLEGSAPGANVLLASMTSTENP